MKENYLVNCNIDISSRNHMRCYAALINFYKALKDYVQEEMWRSSSSTQSDVPEGTYTELCSKFFEIFLLTSRYDHDNKYSTSVSIA